MSEFTRAVFMMGCFFAAALLTPIAQASESHSDAAFLEADKNKDGSLDEKEFRAHHIIGFDMLDTDEDGALTSPECKNGCITDRYKRDS